MTRLLAAVSKGVGRMRDAHRESGVGPLSQLRQFWHLRRDTAMTPTEYFRYRLWRPELSELDRLRFATLEDRRVSGRKVNPVAGREAIAWKSQGIERLVRGGVPVPELLAVIDPDATSAQTGVDRLRTSDDLAAWLASVPPEGVVMKPETGRQGTDVLVGVAASSDGLQRVDGTLMRVSEIWERVESNRPAPWRIEKRVVAHPDLRGFRRDIVPSLRVQMVVAAGVPTIHAATLKVPSGDSGLDNLSKGNIGAPLDLVSWTLGAGIRLTDATRHSVHPGTGSPIAGLMVPMRQETEDTVRAAALAMLPLRCVGFDVALSTNGPVVFEGNWRFMGEAVQLPQDRGMMHGAYLRLLHEVGADGILAGRRRHAEWREFEAAALQGMTA